MSEKTEGNQKEINYQHYDITLEKLKQFKGFENITEDEALKICAFTVQYCSIIYESIIHSKTFKRDEQSNPRFSKVCQSKSKILGQQDAIASYIPVHTFLFSMWVDMICLFIPFIFILYHCKLYVPARYLALAIGLIFIGYASHFELLSFNVFLENTLTIQNLGILEILLLSYALESRIKAIQAEKMYSSDMLVLELKKKQLLKERINIELEEKVAERTLEINRMNKFLNEHSLHLELEVENLVSARVMQETVSIEDFKRIFASDEVCYNYLVDLK